MRLRMVIESIRGSIYRRGMTRTLILAWDRVVGRGAARTDSESSLRFDSDHGVDTAGFLSLEEIGIDEAKRASSVAYEAVPPALLGAILESLALAHERVTFIDLGAGKGRALLEAARFPFKRIVGVELSVPLAAMASANLARLPIAARRCLDAEVVQADAADHALPPGDLVVFLFNPFGEQVMTRVLARIDAHRATDPAPEIHVIYVNPVLMRLFDRSPFLERVAYRAHPTHDVAVYRARR